MAYQTAIVEFPTSYKPKVIDWSNYESKTAKTEPKWRKENSNPETDIPSVYSKSVLNKIDGGLITFKGKDIAENATNFSTKQQCLLINNPLHPPNQIHSPIETTIMETTVGMLEEAFKAVKEECEEAFVGYPRR